MTADDDSTTGGLPTFGGLVRATEPRPGVLLVELNRPDRLNSMTADLIEELRRVLRSVRDDSRVRAIVLTGAGRAFCAGLDLSGYGEIEGASPGEGRPQAGMRLQKHIADLHEDFRGARAPVIAAINGAAAGAGLSLSLFCDLRLMSSTAALHASFIHRGLGATDIGVSWLLPRMVGFSQASDILLTGRTLDAGECERLGLVSAVHEPDDLLDAALAKAEQIAAHSPMGVWMTKEVLWSNLEVPSFRAAIDLENRSQILTFLTEDHAEAVDAFFERRDANFRNR